MASQEKDQDHATTDANANAQSITNATGDKAPSPTTDAMGPGSSNGTGWSELKDDAERVASQSTRSTAKPETIELEESKNRGGGRHAVGGSSDKGGVDVTPAADRDGGDNIDNDNNASAAGQYKVYKRRWFGLVQLTLLNIIVSWDWLTFSPVASDAASYFGVDETTINWLSTSFLFAFVVMTPVTIWVLHMGPKPSIITASALILVGNWVRYAGSHSSSGGVFGAVMFGQILTGLAQPFILSAPTRYSDLWFTNRGRVAATALTSLANPFGAALGQLIVPFWVNVPGDVSSAVLYVAIISSACSIPSFFIPAAPPTPAAPSGLTPKTPLIASIRILARSVEFWLVFVPFAIYVGFFNSISSLLNQIMQPWGYSDQDSGIAGALLIVVGLVAAAVTSPVLDRTKAFVVAIKAAVPVIGACYLAFVWMPQTWPSLAGPYAVLAVLGAASFSLVPVAVEYLAEVTHPISPEVTSTLAWSGGQLLGGCFILISDALKAGPDASPPYNMTNALIFTAVIALVMVPLPLCLGMFGRRDKVALRRVRSDQMAVDAGREAAPV